MPEPKTKVGTERGGGVEGKEKKEDEADEADEDEDEEEEEGDDESMSKRRERGSR